MLRSLRHLLGHQVVGELCIDGDSEEEEDTRMILNNTGSCCCGTRT